MFSARTKIIAITTAGLLAVVLPAYSLYSMKSRADARIATLEHELAAARTQNATDMQKVVADVQVNAGKLSTTKHDLDQAQQLAETLKNENVQNTQRLRSELAAQSKTMNQLRQKAEALQHENTVKLGTVSGEVRKVRADLDVTRGDVVASRNEISNVRDTLTQQIAQNSSELAELRRRGERSYFAFDIDKSGDLERVADIRVQLKKADTKKQKYDILLQVDDNKFERKDRIANEPVTFLVGRAQLRYELVVNYVDKNRIRGYVSTPGGKAIAAEERALRPQ